jgi:hypothetical protein
MEAFSFSATGIASSKCSAAISKALKTLKELTEKR